MRVFRSKVDATMVMFIVVPIFIAVALIAIQSHGDWRPIAIVLGVVALLSIPMTWSLRATDYRIDGDELRIRSGFLSWRVPIHSIQSIQPTRDMSSAPALSLDRLAIHYWIGGERKTILVSPLDKRGFIDALRAVNPSIRG